MKDCSRRVAPIVKGDRFSLNQCPKNDFEREQMKNISYASVVGSLMYAQVFTRPDIAFAIGMLGRYQSNPGVTRACLMNNGNKEMQEASAHGNKEMHEPNLLRKNRKRQMKLMNADENNHMKNLINEAGFGRVITVGQIDINHHLVTVLVERWRPETHTFHFPHGETTITLQDVALQLGLKIDKLSVIGAITGDVRVACQTLPSDTPPDKYIKGKMIHLTWLRQNFRQLPIDANDVVIAQHARAHIMMLIAPTNVAYISPPSSFCYHPSLSTQMHDMSHEDEEEDDDNNNTNNNDDVP
ncbi:Serine/threonine-protein phosphatase 7 long form-like [Glycine soja]|uniref:Serine/threonine-protein phosphatase 7 long form-like n=1 Tax=Glycine soja TaxID=3848 RepID=A0A445LA47_GLYSO|nr:Serine/threonine-protein phosphatase 7 long form-like [Glycine soja]